MPTEQQRQLREPAHNRLHIGAGQENPPDAHTLDQVGHEHIDAVQDVCEPWPWPANSFREIVANHVLEHVADPLAVFDEAARTLTADGRFVVRVPVGIDARADPTHVREWTWRTAKMWSNESEPWQPGAGLPFELMKRELSLWAHWGGPIVDRVVDRLASRDPLVAQDLPGCSGELLAVYRRVSDR